MVSRAQGRSRPLEKGVFGLERPRMVLIALPRRSWSRAVMSGVLWSCCAASRTMSSSTFRTRTWIPSSSWRRRRPGRSSTDPMLAHAATFPWLSGVNLGRACSDDRFCCRHRSERPAGLGVGRSPSLPHRSTSSWRGLSARPRSWAVIHARSRYGCRTDLKASGPPPSAHGFGCQSMTVLSHFSRIPG